MSLGKEPLCRLRLFSADKKQKTFWQATIYKNELKSVDEVKQKIKEALK